MADLNSGMRSPEQLPGQALLPATSPDPGRDVPSLQSARLECGLSGEMRNAKLMIVDDEPINVEVMRDMLRSADYHQIESTTNPYHVLPLYQSFAPDLILLDLMMPGMNGLEVMEQLKGAGLEQANVPVLVITADASPENRRRALAAKASDYLTKPFDVIELLLRISHLLENRFLCLRLQEQNSTLERHVKRRTTELEEARYAMTRYATELEEAHYETLERLARAGEFRDDDTGQHTLRVSFMASLMAERLGFMLDHVRWIQQAARLHDVGKIGISDLILLKPSKLTDAEFSVMKTHTEIGAQLLAGGQSELIQIAQRIAHSHHERWDGAGYPRGLQGQQIPIEARLLSVADVFDALTHDRPYKEAWPIERAVEEVRGQAGKQFDPQVIEAFDTLDYEQLV